jgi:hypothetical protein
MNMKDVKEKIKNQCHCWPKNPKTRCGNVGIHKYMGKSVCDDCLKMLKKLKF